MRVVNDNGGPLMQKAFRELELFVDHASEDAFLLVPGHSSRSIDDYGAGFILGNAEIRLTDLAAAYAGLARGGWATKPKLLKWLPRDDATSLRPQDSSLGPIDDCTLATQSASRPSGAPV